MGSVDRVGTKMQWWCTLKANGVGFEYCQRGARYRRLSENPVEADGSRCIIAKWTIRGFCRSYHRDRIEWHHVPTDGVGCLAKRRKVIWWGRSGKEAFLAVQQE